MSVLDAETAVLAKMPNQTLSVVTGGEIIYKWHKPEMKSTKFSAPSQQRMELAKTAT
jgi:hypothetical protein